MYQDTSEELPWFVPCSFTTGAWSQAKVSFALLHPGCKVYWRWARTEFIL